MVDNHCRSAHLCCRDSIAWNSPVFPPLYPVSGRHTRRHFATCTGCGRQLMISTDCRSVKFLMSCLALKTCDHSPNFELWCLVLSVELVWYIQRSKLQSVLSVNDSDISILLHKQQYQLSKFMVLRSDLCRFMASVFFLYLNSGEYWLDMYDLIRQFLVQFSLTCPLNNSSWISSWNNWGSLAINQAHTTN